MRNQLTLMAWLYRYKAHHVLMWVAYFLFFFLMYRGFYPNVQSLLVVISVYFIFNALAFYITAYYLFERYLHHQKWAEFFVLFLLLMTVLSILLSLCLHLLFRIYAPQVEMEMGMLFQMSFLSIFTMAGLMGGVKLFSDKIKSDKKNRALEKQRLESELQYLKAQVNPHFLFNSINSIYFLIRKNPEEAAATLIRLSDLLRFQLYDCSEELISLEKEIEYLNNFIGLEKIRKGEKLKVHFSVSGDLVGLHVAPFLFMPFVENAFKHVSTSNNEDNRIDIKLSAEGNTIVLEVGNSYEAAARNLPGGIGLPNVRRRLELLYPNRHQLAIKEDGRYYFVALKLQIA